LHADDRDVPIGDALARIAEIEQLVQRAVEPTVPSVDSFAPTLAAAEESAQQETGTLPAATSPYALTTALSSFGSAATGAGPAALRAAEGEVGQSEEPPGSNDGPRLGLYRSAVDGAVPGAPWCAYFVSWAASQAGAPLGFDSRGIGSVEGIESWAQATGRLLPAGSVPQPGDLILFGGRHVGIVESVNPDGSLTTVEGNHNERVDRVQRSPAEATGYVRL
jgi:hypothetical protein